MFQRAGLAAVHGALQLSYARSNSATGSCVIIARSTFKHCPETAQRQFAERAVDLFRRFLAPRSSHQVTIDI
jgi:hypothetical protein